MAKRMAAAVFTVLAALVLTGCGGVEESVPAPFARGVWDGDVYTSEYASLTFTLPSGWKIMPDDELAESMELEGDEMSEPGMPFTEEMQELEEIPDIMVTSRGTASFVLVGYINLSKIDGGKDFTEDDYLEYEKQKLDESGESIEPQLGDYNRVKTIGGKKYTLLENNAWEYDISEIYAVRRIGDYMLTIYIYATGNTSADDLLACFS